MTPKSLEDIILAKACRIASGRKPRTIDLFAGCGGLSLGFHRAGCEIVAAVEFDPEAKKHFGGKQLAAETHEKNFKPLNPNYKLFGDITRLKLKETVAHCAGLFGSPEEAVDIVIGGPPCQPFSRVGRAKLREVAGHPRAFEHDPRVTMYTYFMAFVEELLPIAFLMENVKEITRFKGGNIAESIALEADGLGYEVRYALLNSAWYGVPQMRERVFIIGIHKALGVIPGFPEISHKIELPVGYVTSRMGNGRPEVLPPYDHFVDDIPFASKTLPAVTAREAIGDLPAILEHLDGRAGKGIRRCVTRKEYNATQRSAFAEMMASWPGFRNRGFFVDHDVRYTPRDYPIFAEMKPGDQYPQAHAIAERLFRETLEGLRKQGKRIREGSPEYVDLRNRIIPPYDPHKYPNKWIKMRPDFPVRTIPAHLGKDSYSHIHYDSKQARSISIREAARLQSFPDGFDCVGTYNPRGRQIGNSVPPLMAFALAKNLVRQLRRAAKLAQKSNEVHDAGVTISQGPLSGKPKASSRLFRPQPLQRCF